MADQDLNITVNDVDINAVVGDNAINLTLGATNIELKTGTIGTANFVNADGKFFLDGNGGDTYLKFNSTTSRVEIWVEGTKQGEWGAVSGGNPFA